VGAGHAGVGSGLLHDVRSPVHELPAEAKLVAALVFVLAVVATPREAVWAFALHGTLALVVLRIARLPAGFVARRLRLELPFVAFALLLPLVGSGPDVEVLGLGLSRAGLWGAWGVLVKGLLGVLAAIVLAATTPLPSLLRGLERLHVPPAVTAIAGAMVRYLDVVVGEADRMRIARLARGGDGRWLWQAKGVAASVGTLFVRAYERGERVHLAMAARGFTGTLPPRHAPPPRRGGWGRAAPVPLAAVVVAAWAAVAV
jgi:cobalt/nickel transport system permease protein